MLRVLADRPKRPARFLVLGSVSPDLLRQTSESLAGRIAYFELDGFNLEEVTSKKVDRLWVRGGFPRSFLARSESESLRWRQQFLATFLERDIPSLGFRIPALALDRFWRMLAHWHGQIWNGSEFGRSLGVTDATVRHYLDILASTFVVTVLRPFHQNLAKRQVKSPKVYVADSGLIKRSDAPSVTPSMRAALTDLRLERIDVIHAGAQSYFLGERIRAMPLARLLDELPRPAPRR